MMSRSALIATVMTAIMLPVLVALGAWQWQRMHWKAAMLDRLAKADQAAPREYAFDPAGTEFGFPDRVTVRGRLNHVKAQRVWVPTPDGKSERVLTPLTLAGDFRGDGCGMTPTLFVDRGIRRSDAAPEVAPPAGDVVISGRLFNTESSAFVSSSGTTGLWTLIDIAAMGEIIRPPAHDCVPDPDVPIVAPVFLEAEAASAPGAPQPMKRAITLSNRHFEYALTWWSFAIVLLVVYALFMRNMRHKKAVLQ
jgi:surfeit locus 1 family protein